MGRDIAFDDGLLEYDHIEVARGPAEEMLRPLPDKIPTQVRKAEQERLDSGLRCAIGLDGDGCRLGTNIRSLLHSVLYTGL
ncbi:MAG TPA: hypothetical protein VGC68_02040 [Enterovirga sp.]